MRGKLLAAFTGGCLAFGYQFIKPVFVHAKLHPFIKSLIA